MYLESKIEVTYNDPSTISGQQTGIIRGYLGRVSILQADGGKEFNKLQANFAYITPEGAVIHQNAFTTEGAEMEQLWAAIKDGVPTDKTYQETETTKYYLAFMVVMAQTFGIGMDDITLVP